MLLSAPPEPLKASLDAPVDVLSISSTLVTNVPPNRKLNVQTHVRLMLHAMVAGQAIQRLIQNSCVSVPVFSLLHAFLHPVVLYNFSKPPVLVNPLGQLDRWIADPAFPDKGRMIHMRLCHVNCKVTVMLG